MLLLSLLLSASLQTTQASPLEDGFSATYTLSKNSFAVATVKRQLKINNQQLIYTSHAEVTGLASLFIDDVINQRSVMQISNDQLRSLQFEYEQKSSKEQHQYKISFDKTAGKILNSWKNTSYPLDDNAVDILSLQIILAKRLKSGSSNRSFTLAEKKHFNQYTLKHSGTETLHYTNNDFVTEKYSYFDKRKKRLITIWCAKSLDFLPIRIQRKDDDGDITLLELSHWGNKVLYRDDDDEQF